MVCDIGLGGEHTETLRPSEEYSKEAWEKLPENEQNEWLYAQTWNWAVEFLDCGFELLEEENA